MQGERPGRRETMGSFIADRPQKQKFASVNPDYPVPLQIRWTRKTLRGMMQRRKAGLVSAFRVLSYRMPNLARTESSISCCFTGRINCCSSRFPWTADAGRRKKVRAFLSFRGEYGLHSQSLICYTFTVSRPGSETDKSGRFLREGDCATCRS